MNDNVLNEVAELLSSLNKKDTFDKVKQSLKEMESIVENIEAVSNTADKKYIEKKLLDLSYKQSSIYEFILNMSSNKDKFTSDCSEKIDENIFKMSLFEDQKIILSTPFPPMKIGDFRSETSKIFATAITKMLDKKLKEFSKEIPLYSKANVTFELYIGSDMQGSPVPDADNLDLKNILDAMQTYLFPDDNILTIAYHIRGLNTSDYSHMKIIIEEIQNSIF